jgi:hypothetical protein
MADRVAETAEQVLHAAALAVEFTSEAPASGKIDKPDDKAVTHALRTYTVSHRTREQLDQAFIYHAPNAEQPLRYQALRYSAKELAEMVALYCPDSREKSVALTKIDEAVMWANAAIARNEDRGDHE